MSRQSFVRCLVVCLGVTACSTTYSPRVGPGIRVTYSDGQPAFWKDGAIVQKGVFSSKLGDAMADIAEAKAHVDTWRSRNITGISLTIVGFGLVGAGAGLIEPGAGFNSRNGASLGLMSGGLVTTVIAAIVIATGQAHLWDGINIYNDRITEPRTSRVIAPPSVAPTGFALRW